MNSEIIKKWQEKASAKKEGEAAKWAKMADQYKKEHAYIFSSSVPKQKTVDDIESQILTIKNK